MGGIGFTINWKDETAPDHEALKYEAENEGLVSLTTDFQDA